MMKSFCGAALMFASALQAQKPSLTAAQVVSRIRERAGVEVRANTVDIFKAGDSTANVAGVALTMMATLDVLQRAVARGDNFIITHEPTYFTSRDTLAILEHENDAILAFKQKYIADHGLIIWRFHDTPHAMKPDMIRSGIIHALGWESRTRNGDDEVFDLPRTSLGALADQLAKKLDARAVRISGDPSVIVSSAVLTNGFPGFAENRHAVQRANPDVLIIGEDHEWETIEYAADAITAGKLKGLIVLGHVPSEQLGMDEFARWLRPVVPEVRVDFIPTRDPFHYNR
jgi:putative NIF3 family GTP cyclohydrolase 1 type 2